ncbi:MAG: NUDIX hydrolase [Oscillospiraceae bacterium]|nr:NUDIX hydrolase [Oscillospiraceae bacterium]
MDYTEKAVRHVNTYGGIIVDVDVDMVKLPNGAVTMREVVHHPGGVCIAAVDEAGLVSMVRQYRYPFQTHLWELPAGKLEPGEEPFPAAKRELSEETGLEAENWQLLGQIYTSPGFSTETLYIYLATGLHQGAAHPDPNEFLDVEKWPMDTLLSRIATGEIRDAKTVVGGLRAASAMGTI